MNTRRVALLAALALAPACLVEAPSDLDSSQQPIWNHNGLSFDGLTFNGATFDGTTFSDLAFSPLATAGLSIDAFAANGFLQSPEATAFATYLVRCALAEGQTIAGTVANGTYYEFAGSVGLAPTWDTKALGAGKQRWVTACLLAMGNAYGVTHPMSMRGSHAALALGADVNGDEATQFDELQGIYWGNLFDATRPNAKSCFSNSEFNGLHARRGSCAHHAYAGTGLCGEVLGSKGACVANSGDGKRISVWVQASGGINN